MRDDAHPETTSIEGKPAMDTIQARIEAWDFTPAGAAIRFEEKLAREHGWTLGRAREVVREYRRFLVLTLQRLHLRGLSKVKNQSRSTSMRKLA